MILQRPPESQKFDPATTAVFSEFPQYADVDTRVEVDAHFPAYVDRLQTPPKIATGTLVPRAETRDLVQMTFDTYVTTEQLQSIAGRATWTFLVIFHDASHSSAANYSAQSVTELYNIQDLINNTTTPVNNHANCTWYVDCGAVTNSSFQRINASDIDTLIADFQAIYGDVDAPNYAGNILP